MTRAIGPPCGSWNKSKLLVYHPEWENNFKYVADSSNRAAHYLAVVGLNNWSFMHYVLEPFGHLQEKLDLDISFRPPICGFKLLQFQLMPKATFVVSLLMALLFFSKKRRRQQISSLSMVGLQRRLHNVKLLYFLLEFTPLTYSYFMFLFNHCFVLFVDLLRGYLFLACFMYYFPCPFTFVLRGLGFIVLFSSLHPVNIPKQPIWLLCNCQYTRHPV